MTRRDDMKLMCILRIVFVIAWWICLMAGLKEFGLAGLALVFIASVATAGALISDASLVDDEDDIDEAE